MPPAGHTHEKGNDPMRPSPRDALHSEPRKPRSSQQPRNDPVFARFLATALLLTAIVLAALASTPAKASNVQFVGTVAYSYVGNFSVLTANRVENFEAGGNSGTLRMELWAFSAPYAGGAQVGYKLAEHTLGQLTAGYYYSSIVSGSAAFAYPPNGTWYFAMLLTEYTGAATDNGYTVRDYVSFSDAVVIGSPTPAPSAVTPQIGLWWNSDESGSGYAFDYKHGVLVVTVYSYQANGSPQWYLASGSLSGTTFTATLDKYGFGQCISCAYRGSPMQTGSDGTITIIFSSATSATVYLPGGRVSRIQPQAF